MCLRPAQMLPSRPKSSGPFQQSAVIATVAGNSRFLPVHQRSEGMQMNTTVTAARLGPSDLAHLLTLGGRMFVTEGATPCRDGLFGRDLWFSPYRDREQAARRCLDCPFLGRCRYNAVLSRATHGGSGGGGRTGGKVG